MFIGEFNANLNDSHRLSIPNNFKKYLEETLVIVKGFEKCLYLYNQSDWLALSDKINQLSFTKSANRLFVRGLNSGAFEVEVDAKGRVCIMQKLIDHAGLSKECVIVGASNRMEIWDRLEWENYMKQNQDMIATLGEELDI